MSFETIPNVTLNYGSLYEYRIILNLIITDTTLTCAVKKWSISTNYPLYFTLDEYWGWVN